MNDIEICPVCGARYNGERDVCPMCGHIRYEGEDIRDEDVREERLKYAAKDTDETEAEIGINGIALSGERIFELMGIDMEKWDTDEAMERMKERAKTDLESWSIPAALCEQLSVMRQQEQKHRMSAISTWVYGNAIYIFMEVGGYTDSAFYREHFRGGKNQKDMETIRQNVRKMREHIDLEDYISLLDNIVWAEKFFSEREEDSHDG